MPAGRIRNQAEWMSEILRSPDRSELVLVTLAEELPTIETEETMALIDKSNLIGSTMVVTNRVLNRLHSKPMEGHRHGGGSGSLASFAFS